MAPSDGHLDSVHALKTLFLGYACLETSCSHGPERDLLKETYPELPSRIHPGALAGRGGGRSSPGTEPPLPYWREGRDPLPASNAGAGSPRGKSGKPKSGIRSSLPPGGGKIS
ncbi:hypothetical protein E2320_014372 [Naja naja]|nr:hypothetical protein E2320_014372 [Naja naja]